MSHELIELKNIYWQVGILPGTGASIAYGRAWNGSAFVDVMRPTAEADYGNSSNCASFIMLPWANRIGGGVLRLNGETYQLKTVADDGTARHGDVRNRPFTVTESSARSVTLTLDSWTQADVNWPFTFRAEVTYRLAGSRFEWELALTNTDTRLFTAGFGHHPYFVRPSAPQPVVQIPVERYFPLTRAMATGESAVLPPELDFRAPRPLQPDETFDHLLTGRIGDEPAHMDFPDRKIGLVFEADSLFAHWVLYAPAGKPFFALEPQTNANDGFALAEKGISGSGVFTLQPGETKTGVVSLKLNA